MPVSKLVGTKVKRREDPRLVQGLSHYVDDLRMADVLQVAILRSPHAHARVNGINTDAAAALPGVVSVVTGADIGDSVGSVPCAAANPTLRTPPHPVLAQDEVPLRRRTGGRGGGRGLLHRAGRPRPDRGGLRAAAGGVGPREGAPAGLAARPFPVGQQPGLHLRVRHRGHGQGPRRGGRHRQAEVHPPAARADPGGDPRRGGAVFPGRGRVDRLELDPDSASPPGHAGAHAQLPGTPHPDHRPGGGRRLRMQAERLPGGGLCWPTSQ